jgi:hypothetical protein
VFTVMNEEISKCSGTASNSRDDGGNLFRIRKKMAVVIEVICGFPRAP